LQHTTHAMITITSAAILILFMGSLNVLWNHVTRRYLMVPFQMLTSSNISTSVVIRHSGAHLSAIEARL
jgi:hypothetical protein